MKKLLSSALLLLFTFSLNAQSLKISAGPELLRSFHHASTFWGVGATAQADVWVKERLGLGINTGFLRFTGMEYLWGADRDADYNLIPVLGVIRYPLPITKGLYGQDMMGYTFAQDVVYSATRSKVSGGFTYYFALGYVIKERIDVSVKVGRSRLDKKNNPANVNEHNLGLKVAWVF